MSATAGVSTEATPRMVEVVAALLLPPRIATRPKVGLDKEEKATVVEARQPNQSENEARRMMLCGGCVIVMKSVDVVLNNKMAQVVEHRCEPCGGTDPKQSGLLVGANVNLRTVNPSST